MARQLDGIAKRMAACEKRLREALTQRWAVSGRVEHTLQGCAPRALHDRTTRLFSPPVRACAPGCLSACVLAATPRSARSLRRCASL